MEKVVGAEDPEERAAVRGLDPARVDIIVAGVLILDEIFEELGIKRMVVSEYALREGIILDTFEKRRNRRSLHHLHDIRYQSVLHLAENFRYERKHSHHVSKLALALFDQTKRLHGLGATVGPLELARFHRRNPTTSSIGASSPQPVPLPTWP